MPDDHEVMRVSLAQENIAKGDTAVFETGIDPASFAQVHLVSLKKFCGHGKLFNFIGSSASCRSI